MAAASPRSHRHRWPTNLRGKAMADGSSSSPSGDRRYRVKGTAPARGTHCASVLLAQGVVVSSGIRTLLKRLEACPAGAQGWREFEDVCTDTLSYLFVPPLGKPII